MLISQIKPNPENPRIIKDHKFKQLVESIKSFPQMLELRPIVIDENNIVLGGNMRLKACTEAGLTDVPVIYAKDLTEEQKKEFIIKDNVGYGEWDWEDLANSWDANLLTEWGLDIPNWSAGHSINNMSEDDLDLSEEFDAIGISKNLQKVVFVFDGAEDAESWLKQFPNLEIKKNSQVWQINLNTPFI